MEIYLHANRLSHLREIRVIFYSSSMDFPVSLFTPRFAACGLLVNTTAGPGWKKNQNQDFNSSRDYMYELFGGWGRRLVLFRIESCIH